VGTDSCATDSGRQLNREKQVGNKLSVAAINSSSKELVPSIPKGYFVMSCFFVFSYFEQVKVWMDLHYYKCLKSVALSDINKICQAMDKNEIIFQVMLIRTYVHFICHCARGSALSAIHKR